MRRPAATLNRSDSRSSGQNSLRKTAPQPKKPEQIDLIARADEPEAKRDEWLLESPSEGPGTMRRDAYVAWRYLLARPCLQSEIEKILVRDKDWDVMRTGRAIKRAIGAGWVYGAPTTRLDSAGQSVADLALTARPGVV
jgi:hypothetical protein